jgi:hypothetical protein
VCSFHAWLCGFLVPEWCKKGMTVQVALQQLALQQLKLLPSHMHAQSDVQQQGLAASHIPIVF